MVTMFKEYCLTHLSNVDSLPSENCTFIEFWHGAHYLFSTPLLGDLYGNQVIRWKFILFSSIK